MKADIREFRNTLQTLLVAAVTCGMLSLSAGVGDAAVAEDLAICDQVEDELLLDQAVSSVNIDVSCNEGIVTLDGTVDNILAKDRAQRLTETVRGVLSVVNLIAVQPPQEKSDPEIQDAIETALLHNPATESYEVTVTVQDGVATLDGTVDSWQEKQLSAHVAKEVAGVTEIDNQIGIEVGETRIDSEIKNDVEQSLTRDVFLDGAGLIDVSVEDGKVTLTGTVGSVFEKGRARTQAWVTGVSDVDNSALEVANWADEERERNTAYPTLSDSEIEEAVNHALLYDPRTNSFAIDVSCVDGYVALRGTVDNLKAKRAAEQDARNTIGVYSVNNRLQVRTDGELTDADIQERVENALLRNPYTDSFEITVLVENGTANLYGTVDSYFEKAEADDVSSNVRGVNFVDNNLVVSDTVNSYVYDPYVDSYDPYGYDWYDYDRPYTFETDADIEDDIEDELWWSPFVDSDQVSVTVENAEATLTGTVDSVMERQAAAENAIEGGAVSVDNELTIE